MANKKVNRRADHSGPHRTAYEKNRLRILKTQNTCAICGQFVDVTLKSPNPMAPEIDHVIPISRNGHPSDISNLQLVHRSCNQMKSDKIYKELPANETKQIDPNRNLPQSMDWTTLNVSDDKEDTLVQVVEQVSEPIEIIDNKDDWSSLDLLRGYKIRK